MPTSLPFQRAAGPNITQTSPQQRMSNNGSKRRKLHHEQHEEQCKLLGVRYEPPTENESPSCKKNRKSRNLYRIQTQQKKYFQVTHIENHQTTRAEIMTTSTGTPHHANIEDNVPPASATLSENNTMEQEVILEETSTRPPTIST